VASVAPAAAPPETEVTLTGTGLATVEAVRLRHPGGEDPATLVRATDTTLVFRTGVLAHGRRTVTLVVAGTPHDFPASFHVLPVGMTLAAAAAGVRTDAENAARARGLADSEVARAGAEAEAAYLGLSRTHVRIAGDNAAARVIQEAIEARLRARMALRTPDGRRQAHRQALERLDENLSKNYSYTEWGTRDAIVMADDYFTGRGVIDVEAARFVPLGTYAINYAYLYGDPYQFLFNNEIDRLVPHEVTADQVNEIRAALEAAMGGIPVYNVHHLARAFDVMQASADDIRKPVYKRIKRLYDEVQARHADGRGPASELVRDWGASAVGELAFQLARQAIPDDHGRCIDGIRDGDNDLGRSYLKFELGAMWDDPLDPDPDHPADPPPPEPPVFFLPAAHGQNVVNTRITREYCLHQLEKYGYIIRR